MKPLAKSVLLLIFWVVVAVIAIGMAVGGNTGTGTESSRCENLWQQNKDTATGVTHDEYIRNCKDGDRLVTQLRP